MDELQAFFNDRSGKIVKLRGPLSGGVRIAKDDSSYELDKRDDHRRSKMRSGTDYVDEIKQKETELYLKMELERKQQETMSGGLESLEQLSTVESLNTAKIAEDSKKIAMNFYDKFSFDTTDNSRKRLPIEDYKQQILDSIESFPVVIVEGPTGCGKTTQVPQWILDDSRENCRRCNIVVTQPRRIAAISIAKRVAQERGWNLGELVGYQVGLDNKTSNETCIHYVTTGILLQKLVSSKSLNEYTHVILDEVHERGQEMDFLLLVVRKLLYTVSPTVTVVLMSATFNRNAFANYFRIPTPRGPQTTVCVKVDNPKPLFTVKHFYLNNLTKFSTGLLNSAQNNPEPGIAPEMYHLVIKLINAFEQIDPQENVDRGPPEPEPPSVLIFLPGINEIEELYTHLTDTQLRVKIADEECGKHRWWVLPLHSTITADEQVRVFQKPPPGYRKIILSTNIAESSITVPDIKYVIDFCLMKTLVADSETNFTSLRMVWASKTNCEQRAGRSGRVRDGRVYRLVTDTFYNGLMDDCPPEIKQCPLERLVLLSKMLDMGKPSDVLALAMDPPDISNINRTILVLKEMGAMKKTSNDDEWCSSDGDITYLGRIMAKLPVDVRASKLIALGFVYGCLEECVIMAAALSVKNVFNYPFLERLNAYNSKLTWADGSTSDCIAFLNVYKVWQHLRRGQQFKIQDEKQWSSRFYVQVRAIRELDAMVRELRVRLSREGIDTRAPSSPWAKNELCLALKVVIAGAFYPQYFVQASQDETREREAVRTLSGRDPRNTVYLSNFPDHQPGVVYASIIRNKIRQLIEDEPVVTFDKISRKVYLTFNDGKHVTNSERERSGNPAIPGQVALPIYKSIKARQLRLDIKIPLLPIEKANALAEAIEISKANFNLEKMVPRLPDIDDTHFPLSICHVVNVGRFWARYDDESTALTLSRIHRALNGEPLVAYSGTLAPGDHYAAPYVDANGTSIHRARVLKLLPKNMVEILYIDYGSFGRVSVSNLRELPKDLCSEEPPLAMQCVLAELSAAPMLDERCLWSPYAERYFHETTRKGHLLGKVYSVVHGVVAIELLAEGGKISINKELIKRGYAIPSEESYESKSNHDLRLMANELNLAQKRAYNKEQTELAYLPLHDAAPPDTADCISNISLKGPFSPLETSVHSLMYASREKQVQIEWNSVNSVLLDTDPQLTYERLLVAAEVGHNENNNKLTLRHTTLMPNIPALPAIIALLFCPVAELRRDAMCTRYVSTLCGLGSDETGAPHFPEHDILVNIDADVHVDDIGLINHIRHLMDYMLYCSDAQDIPNPDDKFLLQIPGIIRQELMQLLTKRRKHREPEFVPNAWEWNSVPQDELMEITVPEMVDRAVVYPLHSPLELTVASREHILELKRENELLKLLVSRTPISSSAEMACKLCGTAPMPSHALRIHLYSNAHKEKEEDFALYQS